MIDSKSIDTASPIGKPEDRVDGRLKVTGAAKYSAEFNPPGVAHAVLVMSTIASGTIAKMDTDAAMQVPGVSLVLTPFNAPALPGYSGGNGWPGRALTVLQDKNVYYDNQPIGLVIADTWEAARYASSLVRTSYAEQTPLTDIDIEKAAAYAPDMANRVPTDSARGTAGDAYDGAAVKIDNLYTTPIENHNPMEPHATVAVWDAPDRLTVYDSTQGIFGVQGTLAAIFGLPGENVRCLTYFVGGGFGCKGSVWSHVPLAAMAAKQLGRPVKLSLSRHDMFGMVGYRPITQQTISLACDKSGKLGFIDHQTNSQTSVIGEFTESCGGVTRMLYACPNVFTSHRLTRLNYGTPTFMRAPGESTGTYALESAMDELAYAAGVDPLDLRLANYAETDPNQNKPYSSKSLRECYAVVAKQFGWSRRNPAPRSMHTPDGLLVGYGLGTCTYPTFRSPSSATARILADGRAVVKAGTQDIGTGTYTVMTQIAAAGLGIAFDRVRFQLGDTRMPRNPGSGGSQTAASTGSGVLAAAEAARDAAIALAIADSGSPLHGLAATDVAAGDGRLHARAHPEIGETYAALIGRAKLPYIEATGDSRQDQSAYRYAMHAFGAVMTEVHVDPDLGTVRVARVVGAYGVGNRLNAKTARSQLIGGIIMGLGMALTEQTVVDKRTGRMVTADLAEYLVPVNADVPAIDVIFVDEDDPIVNPLGIKGIGEIGITGVVGSLCNAVYHATGVRVRDLPVTLDKLITA